MNPCRSSEKEEEEEEDASSLSCDSVSLDSLLLFVLPLSPLSPLGAAFFISDTFKQDISSGMHLLPTWQAEQSVVTFFRTAALYKLEDLLLLKTSCSISTARDRVSQLREDMKDDVERYFCKIDLS